MVRNLYIQNVRPPSVTRSWRNSTGPREVHLMTSATTKDGGDEDQSRAGQDEVHPSLDDPLTRGEPRRLQCECHALLPHVLHGEAGREDAREVACRRARRSRLVVRLSSRRPSARRRWSATRRRRSPRSYPWNTVRRRSARSGGDILAEDQRALRVDVAERQVTRSRHVQLRHEFGRPLAGPDDQCALLERSTGLPVIDGKARDPLAESSRASAMINV